MVSPSPIAAQAPGGTGAAVPATVALVETWPDGRINYELTTTRRASMWTPNFPREDGFQPPKGDFDSVRWDDGTYPQVHM